MRLQHCDKCGQEHVIHNTQGVDKFERLRCPHCRQLTLVNVTAFTFWTCSRCAVSSAVAAYQGLIPSYIPQPPRVWRLGG